MELADEFIAMFSKISSAEKTNNYYFQKHDCPVAGENIKISFEHIIAKEDSVKNAVEAVRFGVCPHCGKMYYTYENERFLKIKR